MLKLSKSYSYTDSHTVETAAGTYIISTVYTDVVPTKLGNAVNRIAPTAAIIIGAIVPIISTLIIS